jgi:hypothetical protein
MKFPVDLPKEERDIHAAKKVLKIGHHQKMILDTTLTCYNDVINDLLLKHKARPPKILKRRYDNAITMAQHSNIIDACEDVLILQGKITSMSHADSYHTKLQKGAEKLHNAIALSDNRRFVEESLVFKRDKNVVTTLYMKRLIRTLVFKGLVLTS